MQSFIVNVPEEKTAFFVELMEQLSFELLDIDEDQIVKMPEKTNTEDDSFLDWEAERKKAKELRRKK